MVRLASEIPSGWVRETRLDGRMPVGAGQATGITSPALFNEDTDYGASWTHAHGMTNHTHDMGGHMHSTPAHGHATPNHGHGVTALTVTGALGAATGSDQANAISPGTSFALGTHTHANGTLDVGGSIGSDGASSTNGTDGGGTSGPVGVVTSVGPVPGNTSSDVWLIPSHSYVYCRKT
jgi:hypothetical protein